MCILVAVANFQLTAACAL